MLDTSYTSKAKGNTRKTHTIRPRRLVWSVVFSGSSGSASQEKSLRVNLPDTSLERYYTPQNEPPKA